MPHTLGQPGELQGCDHDDACVGHVGDSLHRGTGAEEGHIYCGACFAAAGIHPTTTTTSATTKGEPPQPVGKGKGDGKGKMMGKRTGGKPQGGPQAPWNDLKGKGATGKGHQTNPSGGEAVEGCKVLGVG